MKNIHILPTDKPSRLFSAEGKLFNYHKPQEGDGVKIINQNIYITNSEEIKEGDYGLVVNEILSYKKMIELWGVTQGCKIILTTDSQLIKDSVQAINDEFLEWFVKNPSCESVKVEKEQYHQFVGMKKLPLIPNYKIKMKNIHILPTDKPSRLHFTEFFEELVFTPKYEKLDGVNIYITSDKEEIKDCYVINTKKNEIYFENWYSSTPFIKKIILTTDQDLIKDGVQAIDEEFLQWFIKNPSCEEVEIKSKITKDGVWTDLKGYVELPTIHSINYKIIIPKEEPKQDKTNKMKQTAVEWLISKIQRYNDSGYEFHPKYNEEIIEQAKEMEKQEKIEFAEYCVELQYESFKTGEDIDADSMEELLETFKNK